MLAITGLSHAGTAGDRQVDWIERRPDGTRATRRYFFAAAAGVPSSTVCATSFSLTSAA